MTVLKCGYSLRPDPDDADVLARRIVAYDYEIFDYCKDAWLNLWLRRLFGTALAEKLGIVFGILIVLIGTGLLHPLGPFLFAALKWSIAPFIPFLKTGGNVSSQLFWSYVTPVFMVVNFLLGVCAFLIAIDYGYRPNKLVVGKNGVFLVQPAVEHDTYYERQGVTFDGLKAIRLIRADGSKSSADYQIDFQCDDGGSFRIRMGDIVEIAARRKFLDLVKERSPVAPDQELFDVFEPLCERESYTEIWLRELTAAPKRDKLAPLTQGTTLQNGKYAVISKIGMGGQGTVYLASNRQGDSLRKEDETVALKEYVLPVFPDMRVRRSAAEKFEMEAELLRKIQHPNIARFIELFIEDHRAYLVLERAQGHNLKRIVSSSGKLAEEMALVAAVKMCDIMAYLHGKEPPIIHRDFTPDNLIVDSDGNIKLIDFSVAQHQELNVTGTVVGKYNYISPEQFRGKPSLQSDIYSLGATLHFLLTGEEPEAITQLHPRVKSPEISEALDSIIARATALSVADRYQTVQEMKLDLERLVDQPKTAMVLKLDQQQKA